MFQKFLRAPLSQVISEEGCKLIEAAQRLPLALWNVKKIEKAGDSISVANLLSYQIGWGTLVISWYETGIRGEMPEMPGEGFSKCDYVGLASHFSRKYGCASPQELVEELSRVVRRILEIVEREYLTGNLDRVGVWPWCTLRSGKAWPLSKWIGVNTVSPYKRALHLIRKMLKSAV